MQHLGLSAKTGRSHHSPAGQAGNPACNVTKECVARILAWQQTTDLHSIGQLGRHILHGMDRQMDTAIGQLFLDFLGEKALAAKCREGPVADTVTGRGDDHDLHHVVTQVIVRGYEPSLDLVRLPQRQRAAAGTDPNARLSVHGQRCYLPTTRLTSIREASGVKILGIETSCDETAAAVVTGDGVILSNIVHSQIDDHTPFAGVVPEIAARAHVEKLDGVIERALVEADCGLSDVDAVAATAGPGLIGGVMVGFTTAKALSLATGKPLVAVNHLEAHALTVRMTDQVAFPYLLLLVSGGHCQILLVHGVGDYRRLGATIDDAVGEAFDKTAKLLQLGFPGGPAVERRP